MSCCVKVAFYIAMLVLVSFLHRLDLLGIFERDDNEEASENCRRDKWVRQIVKASQRRNVPISKMRELISLAESWLHPELQTVRKTLVSCMETSGASFGRRTICGITLVEGLMNTRSPDSESLRNKGV